MPIKGLLLYFISFLFFGAFPFNVLVYNFLFYSAYFLIGFITKIFACLLKKKGKKNYLSGFGVRGEDMWGSDLSHRLFLDDTLVNSLFKLVAHLVKSS